MQMDQIVTEIRDLSDRLDRQETAINDLIIELQMVTERMIPASVARVEHQQSGVYELLAGVAGTTAKLANQFASLTDRVTLIEKSWE